MTTWTTQTHTNTHKKNRRRIQVFRTGKAVRISGLLVTPVVLFLLQWGKNHFCGHLWNRHSVTVVVSVNRRIQVREVQYKEHFKKGKYVLVITLKYTLCQILVKLQYERFLISKYYVEWHSSQMMILSIKNSITSIKMI